MAKYGTTGQATDNVAKYGTAGQATDNVAKYGTMGQATDDNIIRRMRFSCWINKATLAHSG